MDGLYRFSPIENQETLIKAIEWVATKTVKLGELATNPLFGSAEHLPYRNIGHLRDCLEILKGEYEKHMKTVQRVYSGELLYRTIASGFYVGAGDEILFYPYPGMKELENINYEFFRGI